MIGLQKFLPQAISNMLTRSLYTYKPSLIRRNRPPTLGNLEGSAVIVELGKNGGHHHIRPEYFHRPIHRMMHAVDSTRDKMQERKKSHQADPLLDTTKRAPELDLKELEEASFRGFKECYAAKSGDKNYNVRYDYDKNGIIDMVDWLGFGKEMQSSFEEFKAAYGSHIGQQNYNSNYDYDGNGVIDMADWLEFGKKWKA